LSGAGDPQAATTIVQDHLMSPEQTAAAKALAAAHRTTGLTPRSGVVRLIAHRGSGHASTDPAAPPENTVEAVAYGFEHGADAVEIDVWRTADGVVVVHHDDTTDRTTDTPGAAIVDMAYPELRTASAGGWKSARWQGAHVPTLREVTEATPADGALVVEVVEGPQVVDDVIAALGSTLGRTVLLSKNLDTAGELKTCAPLQRTFWIVDTTARWQIGGWAQGHRRGPDSTRYGFDEPADVDWLIAESSARGIDGLDTMLSYPPELPQAVGAAGLTWMVWTVNDPRAIDRCLADGAWAITTDSTADVHAWLRESGMSTAREAGVDF
jgi:glycerophosphoryl diester phosphodiesterase